MPSAVKTGLGIKVRSDFDFININFWNPDYL